MPDIKGQNISKAAGLLYRQEKGRNKSEIQDAKAEAEKLQISGGRTSFRGRGKWTP